jgi:Na+/H+-dicarboxylate symporter
MAQKLTWWIVAAMLAGVLVGTVLHAQYPSGGAELAGIVDMLKLLPDIFMKLIKMIIAPLVLGTIVTGIAGMGDSAALGRIGAKAIGWFLVSSLISLSLGMALVNLFQPGVGLAMQAPQAVGELATQQLNLRHFLLEVFPASAVEAMAVNNVLQILVFSLFAGVALAAIGPAGAPLLQMADALVLLMLQITGYVMRFAPAAVFGAMAAIVAQRGLGIIGVYGQLMAEFYGGLAILWALSLGVGMMVLGRRALLLLRYVREPVLLTFSTGSSEAGLPRLLEQLDRFGVPRRMSGFIVPLGYAFNLTGSMMYTSFASLFIAQAYGIHLSFGTQVLMLLTLMVSSKGIAAVARASLVVIAATLSQFHLPVEGIGLLLGVDTFLDMGRSATNIFGNALATAVITRSEGMLQPPLDPDAPHPVADAHPGEHGRHGLHLDPNQ